MTTTKVDRAAAVRRSLRELVAERGFHGASMSAVAKAAGVAAGTAYVHYESKDELVYATYEEIKRDLGQAVVAAVDPDAVPEGRFHQIWHAVRDHLAADPARARFLTQMEESPYLEEAHSRLPTEDDPLMKEAARPDMAARLAPLPPEVLFFLGFGPAIRLAGSGMELDEAQLEALVRACWRAITA